MSVFLGDGSFEDCVQLGVFAEERDGNLDVLSSEDGFLAALSNTSVPAVVGDYVSSVVRVLDTRFSGWCSVSDAVVTERLRRDYHGDEIASRGMTYEFSERFSGLGKRLYHYKLFEKTGAEARVDRGRGYANHRVRMTLSDDLRVGLRTLQDLANSVEPVSVVKNNFDANSYSEAKLFNSVFFNKNLTFEDVVWLWDSIVCQSNSRFLGFQHVFLLQSVLLREDWSKDELRFFYEWWMNYSSMLDKQLVGEELRNKFEVLSKSVRILFASNVSTPVDLLLSLFDNGDESARIAVAKNSAVGENFVSDVFHGGVVDSSVVREKALLNPVWGFEELIKIAEDENESAGIRFSALFNENVPSFVRELYC